MKKVILLCNRVLSYTTLVMYDIFSIRFIYCLINYNNIFQFLLIKNTIDLDGYHLSMISYHTGWKLVDISSFIFFINSIIGC